MGDWSDWWDCGSSAYDGKAFLLPFTEPHRTNARSQSAQVGSVGSSLPCLTALPWTEEWSSIGKETEEYFHSMGETMFFNTKADYFYLWFSPMSIIATLKLRCILESPENFYTLGCLCPNYRDAGFLTVLWFRFQN